MKIVKKLQKSTILAKVVEELCKEKVVAATGKLKALYRQRDSARKVLKNVEREITDAIEEIEQDESDLNDE